ncbi:MAG: ribbon-helix-helix domain-containing protein [Candidatus Saccharimonadales bacterium]
MSVKTFNISFPEDLADLIDLKAKQQFGSRSDMLRYAAVKYLKDEDELEELMSYGKELGKKTSNQSKKAVARSITEQRRSYRKW